MARAHEGVNRPNVANHRRPVQRPAHLVALEAVILDAAGGDVTNLIATRRLTVAGTKVETSGEGRTGSLYPVRFCRHATGEPDVKLIRVSLRLLAVGLLELVVERLEGRVAERADAHCGVSLLLHHPLELVNARVALPVMDDLDVALEAHVDVFVHLPPALDWTGGLLLRWAVLAGIRLFAAERLSIFEHFRDLVMSAATCKLEGRAGRATATRVRVQLFCGSGAGRRVRGGDHRYRCQDGIGALTSRGAPSSTSVAAMA